MHNVWTRRRFVALSSAALPALNLQTQHKTDAKPKKQEQQEEDVSPAEDLMREHGLLNRVLLIYEESARRIQAKPQEFNPDVLVNSANIIKHFIEEYHEKLEEDHLFPRFTKAHKLADLVATLRAQHAAGRVLTQTILDVSSVRVRPLTAANERERLLDAIRQFIRMYRPHEAREDTILFPALHEIMSRHEYDALGEDFERKEHEMFGKEGFEGMVEKVGGIERELGIYDLAQFTPRTSDGR